MLDLSLVRSQPELVKASVAARQLDPEVVDVDRLLELDAAWRKGRAETDELRHERKQLSARVPKAEPDERQQLIARVRELKGRIEESESRVEDLRTRRDRILELVPNLLAPGVPVGASDDDNVELRRWGTPRELDFEPRDHVELGRLTDTLDFERGAKVAGSAFYYLKREAALLEVALLSFATSRLLAAGFVPVVTPDLARNEILRGIGFQPRGDSTQVYSVEDTELSLVGTAEITLGGLHAGEILDAADLPLRYLGLSHCFRTEAGAHGKESRGLYRVHQFTKAEMFVYSAAADAERLHEEMVGHEEALFQALEIPYRVVDVCSGELGAPAVKKYDLEAWMPGRGVYGEVTSCSNCTDYQARRLDVRYRPQPGASPEHAYLLNGTAIAVSRALIAIYENYQRADGSVAIPEALRPLMAGIEEIPVRLAEAEG